MKHFLVGLMLLACASAHVQANIALSKYRVFFDTDSRTDAIQIRNTGSVSIRYSVELGLVEMTEEGTMFVVSEDPKSAIPFLRFSPKRGVIAPGNRQALRFALRKPAGLEDGEYRAVLKLTSKLDASSVGNVNLNTALTYNVPIIVRHGRVSASSELLQPQLVMKDGTAHIQLWQSREGNRSLFGNFLVTDADGNELGVLNNVATYLPLNRRKVLIPLSREVTGDVTISYNEVAKFGGSIQSSTQLSLN